MSFNAVEYIRSFSHTGKKVTDLSRIAGLLKRLGDPQKGQRFVHIAGTNGKGSVLEYMSSVTMAAGYRTGQFTSPFVECYNDRIRINGENIPDKRLEEICEKVKSAVSDECYSQFEITLSIAFIYFKEENCQIVFLETGIGGLLDATNVIEAPAVSVITSVSLDHTQLLGDTAAEIAVHKAGIIKRGCPVVLSADNPEEVRKVVRKRADECSSRLVIPDAEKCSIEKENIYGSEFVYKGRRYTVSMCGKHQVANAITAIECIELIRNYGFEISDDNIRNGFCAAKVKLRIEMIGKNPLVIADGGHNIAGIDSLVNVIKPLGCNIIGVAGMVKGKAAEYAAARLSEILDYVYCADGFIENNIDAAELCTFFKCSAEVADYHTALQKAIADAREKNCAVLICGSLYLASAARREYFSEADSGKEL